MSKMGLISGIIKVGFGVFVGIYLDQNYQIPKIDENFFKGIQDSVEKLKQSAKDKKSKPDS